MMDDLATLRPSATPVIGSSRPAVITGPVNLIGLHTHYWREVYRFLKVWIQTILAPMVTSLLFLWIFTLAFPGRPPVDGISFVVFITPGIVMMAILNNAFQNTSSSLTISKMQGTTYDFLTAPLTPLELAAGFLAGATTRGLLVGAATLASFAIFRPSAVSIHAPMAMLYFAIIASVFASALGLIVGLWARKFDEMAMITNFIILPLTMLSGTFYPISVMDDPLRTVLIANPFYHLIDGFRYGMTGNSEGNILFGAIVTAALTIVLCVVCWALFRSGYRLRT